MHIRYWNSVCVVFLKAVLFVHLDYTFCNLISPSLHFNGHFFPGGPGLADTRYVSTLHFIGARDDRGGRTTGAIRCANLQSNGHHQQSNTQLFTGRMPFLSPNQQCQSTEWDTKYKAYEKQCYNQWMYMLKYNDHIQEFTQGYQQQS